MLFKAFETTMKPQKTRRQLTEKERQGFLETQGSVCKLCGCTGTELEVDHVLPLCMGGADTLENLQIICKACHAEKTQLETLSFVEESNPLLSRFSVETHKAFVESPKSPQLVANLRKKEGEAISVDIRRSRPSAFIEMDAYDIPIFSPVDSPVPTVPSLAT